MTYYEWWREQTSERQDASLSFMLICKELGEEQRRAPLSQRCKELEAQVAEHYRKWGR